MPILPALVEIMFIDDIPERLERVTGLEPASGVTLRWVGGPLPYH